MTDHAFQNLMNPPYYRWSCGEFSCDRVRDLDKATSDKVEAMMILARGIDDENGKKIYFELPPALCLAMLDVIGREHPQERALEVIGYMNREERPTGAPAEDGL